MIVNIYEAKTKLSQLLAYAESGEEIIIAKAGKPVAYLKPINEKKERIPGKWADQITELDENWWAPLPDNEIKEIEDNLCAPS